jgi:F0F1-type ATP synthase membrane subunit b/b'
LHEAELDIASCKRLNEELGEMIMQAKLQAASICHRAKSEAAALIKKEQLKIEKKLQLKESNEINKILIYKDEVLATIPETSAVISREILEKIKTFYDSKDNTIN